MDEAVNFAEKLLKDNELSKFKVTTTGHSLGGALAEYLAQEKKFKCVSFNGAFPITKYLQNAIGSVVEGIISFFVSKPKEENVPKIVGFHINGDIISNGPHLGDRMDLESIPSYGKHTIDNFVEMVINYEIKTRESHGEKICDYLQDKIKFMRARRAASAVRICSHCEKNIAGEDYDVKGDKYFHLDCVINTAVIVHVQCGARHHHKFNKIQKHFKKTMGDHLNKFFEENKDKMPEKK